MDHKYVVDGKRVILENRPFIHYKYHGEAMAIEFFAIELEFFTNNVPYFHIVRRSVRAVA